MNKLVYKNLPDTTTPIDAGNLNIMTNYIYIQKGSLTTGAEVPQNTDFIIPIAYKVGDGVLDVYYLGTKLILGTHYIEVGNTGATSTRIQLKNWTAPVGKIFEFVIHGEYV